MKGVEISCSKLAISQGCTQIALLPKYPKRPSKMGPDINSSRCAMESCLGEPCLQCTFMPSLIPLQIATTKPSQTPHTACYPESNTPSTQTDNSARAKWAITDPHCNVTAAVLQTEVCPQKNTVTKNTESQKSEFMVNPHLLGCLVQHDMALDQKVHAVVVAPTHVACSWEACRETGVQDLCSMMFAYHQCS